MRVSSTAPTEEPAEDVLDSGASRRGSRSRLRAALVLGLVVVLAAGGLLLFQRLQPDPVPADSAEASESAGAGGRGGPGGGDQAEGGAPDLVDESAERVSGDAAANGGPSFSAALSAATEVVETLCSTDIPSWSARLVERAPDGYDTAVFLMSPANRSFGTFVVQVELTWVGDHYAYTAVAGHVERCR